MEDAQDSEELEYPKTLIALTAFIDGLPPTREVLVRTRLGHAKRSAEGANDVALVNAIDAEGNAFLFFGDTDSLAAAIVQIRTYFDDAMIDYVRARRDATPEPRLRARYAHVIAAYTNRHDEGLRAVDAYVAAVDHYRDVERNEPRESLRALHTLVPLMVSIARRYRAWDRIRPSLIASVRTTNPYLRKAVLALIIDDRAMTSSDLAPLRDNVLQTVRELRGAMELADIQAMADLGIRLDARLGTTDRVPWLRALTNVYREVINSAAHPLMKEQAAQRAALVFQELGDTAGRAEMIRLQREYAGKGLEYHSFSQPIDESGEMAESVRNALDEAFEKGGALRLLGYLGWSLDIMPTLLSRLNDRALTAMELGSETRTVEFKRGAALDTLRYKVVRAALAMTNLRDGGTLVVGIPEASDPTPRGITDADAATYEQDAVLALVNGFASSAIELYVVRVPVEQQEYVFMHVFPFRRTPVICRKNTPDTTPKNERLEAACLYIRTADDKIETTRIRTPAQMEELLEMATEQRARELLRSAERVGFQPPADAEQQFHDELGDLSDLF